MVKLLDKYINIIIAIFGVLICYDFVDGYFKTINSNLEPIFKESLFAYICVLFSRRFPDLILGLGLMSYFITPNHKRYISICLLILVLPIQPLLIYLWGIIGATSSTNSEQYIRIGFAICGIILILFRYINTRQTCFKIILIGSIIYSIVSFSAHYIVIENIMISNVVETQNKSEYLKSITNNNEMYKFCVYERLYCYDNDLNLVVATDYEAPKKWQISNLKTIYENKDKGRSYTFKNDILNVVNEEPFSDKNYSVEKITNIKTPIKISFFKSDGGTYVINLNITRKVNILLIIYSIFQTIAGIVWLIMPCYLIKYHYKSFKNEI